MTPVGPFPRRALSFAVAFLTMVGAAAVALAGGHSSRAQVQDPNDTRGLMDVRRVWFEPEADPPRWTVVTFSPWTAEVTRDRAFVFVRLDTMGDARVDFYAVILSDGRRLSGSLWRDLRRGPDVRLQGIDVRRDSDLTVAVRIPLGSLEIGPLRAVYRWSVVTTFTGRVCRVTCIDRVPDIGTYEQPVGTSPPTTTPTAGPTPSPSARGHRLRPQPSRPPPDRAGSGGAMAGPRRTTPSR